MWYPSKYPTTRHWNAFGIYLCVEQSINYVSYICNDLTPQKLTWIELGLIMTNMVCFTYHCIRDLQKARYVDYCLKMLFLSSQTTQTHGGKGFLIFNFCHTFVVWLWYCKRLFNYPIYSPYNSMLLFKVIS